MNDLCIVIITFNEEFYLSETLNDLLAQTNQNFEVIIVDSNSEDNTVNIANSYASKFQNFKVIEMTERGPSLGRNTGAEAAKAERLLFLDADTRLKPRFVQKSLDALNKSKVDVGGVYIDMSVDKLSHLMVSLSINLGLWVTKFFSPTGVGACIFSTKSAHKLIGGFNADIPIAEDCNYVLKADKHIEVKFKMLPLSFGFDMRRFELEGYTFLLAKYAMVNLRRFFAGEYRTNQIKYEFGKHYKAKSDK